MLVVADLEDFVNQDSIQPPAPEHLLVRIEECRPVIEAFLSKLGSMFQNNPSPSCAMGCALLAAMKMLAPMGGKIIALMGSMPNIHAGALKPRDETKLMGTPKVF
jgi:protein transport protein SEC24